MSKSSIRDDVESFATKDPNKNKLSPNMDLNTISFSSIFDNFYDGVIITDANGFIVYYNKTQAKIDGLDPASVIGKKITDPYPYIMDDGLRPTMVCLKTGKPVKNLACFYRTQKGKVVNSIHNVYPIYAGGQLIGAVCFMSDYNIIEQTYELVSKRYRREEIDTLGLISQRRKKQLSNGTRFTFDDLVGQDQEFLRSVETTRMASRSSSAVMIFGETGTGKELFAQSIHNESPRKMQSYVAINCAAIPENLLEGILFGTSKGAFTGAIDKEGLFQRANGGTLFLDEINSMSIGLQAKLLRTLQERKVRRVGSLDETEIDLKIISSVNKEPHRAVDDGTLRPDLLYRLAVVFIRIPPLRERLADLDGLVSHFLNKCNTFLGKNVTAVSDAVLELFRKYHWPGNVRELEHLIEGAINMVKDSNTIEFRHLCSYIREMPLGKAFDASRGKISATDPTLSCPRTSMEEVKIVSPAQTILPDLQRSLSEIHTSTEIQSIRGALLAASGNAANAARMLKISPQLLHYKLKKYDIKRRG